MKYHFGIKLIAFLLAALMLLVLVGSALSVLFWKAIIYIVKHLPSGKATDSTIGLWVSPTKSCNVIPLKN